jgi:hypothetical protein
MPKVQPTRRLRRPKVLLPPCQSQDYRRMRLSDSQHAQASIGSLNSQRQRCRCNIQTKTRGNLLTAEVRAVATGGDLKCNSW